MFLRGACFVFHARGVEEEKSLRSHPLRHTKSLTLLMYVGIVMAPNVTEIFFVWVKNVSSKFRFSNAIQITGGGFWKS